MEPYLEKKIIVPGEVTYPYLCFITNSNTIRPYVSPHFHDYIEVLYIVKGSMRIQLVNESYDFTSGSIILVDSREVHSTDIDVNIPTEVIVLKFEPQIFSDNDTALEMGYIVPFINPNFSHQKIFKKDELVGTNIPNIIKNIFEEYKSKEYGFELAIKAGIYNIFLWILRNRYPVELRTKLERLKSTINMEKLQKVLKFVEYHYQEEIPLSIMAEMCNMSYSYFSRQFKVIMGKTFKQYLNFVRINEAQKLILTTDMNITEVAMATGFSNSSYFIKQFRLYKNISPKQYKKNVLV